MRLICPTCDTTYDVPSGQIPEAGRHVQCSNCHTRWFARPPAEAAPSEDQVIYRLESRAARPRPVAPVSFAPAPGSRPEPVPEPAPAPVPAPVPAPPAGEPGDFQWESGPVADAGPDPLRPPVTPEARAPEPRPEVAAPPAPPPPPPPPLAVVPPPLAAVAEPEKPAPRPVVPEALRTELAPPPPPRPAEMPSSRPAADAAELDAPDPGTGGHPLRTDLGRAEAEGWDWEDRLPARSRFGRGLLVALVLFALALALYVFAGDLAARVPSLSRALGVYVDLVDGLRAAVTRDR